MPRASLLCLCLLSLAAAAAAARPRHLQNDLPSTPELAPHVLDAALPQAGGDEVRKSCRRPAGRCRQRRTKAACVAVPPLLPPPLPLADALFSQLPWPLACLCCHSCLPTVHAPYRSACRVRAIHLVPLPM